MNHNFDMVSISRSIQQPARKLWVAIQNYFDRFDLYNASDFQPYSEAAQCLIEDEIFNNFPRAQLKNVLNFHFTELFSYPSNWSESDQFSYESAMENFVNILLNKLDGETVEVTIKGSLRQTVPPLEADEWIGHNKEFVVCGL